MCEWHYCDRVCVCVCLVCAIVVFGIVVLCVIVGGGIVVTLCPCVALSMCGIIVTRCVWHCCAVCDCCGGVALL